MAQLLWKEVAFPQNAKHRVTTRPGNSAPRWIPTRIEHVCSHRNLYTNVHSSIVYNSQKGKTTLISIHWEMDKMPSIHTMEWY